MIGGTMHPLNDLEILKKKCQNEYYIFKSYPHVIPQNNCKVLIVTGYDKNIHYSFKEKSENIKELLK